MIKKAINTILIICLIVIWFSVLKKCTNKSKIELDQVSKFSANRSIRPLLKKDTFNLKLTNLNPFKSSNRKTTIKNDKPFVVKKNKEITTLIWPKIEYHGFVKSKHKTTKLALIKINNKLYRTRENQKIDDLLIKKAFSDSILVVFKKQNKIIKTIK